MSEREIAEGHGPWKTASGDRLVLVNAGGDPILKTEGDHGEWLIGAGDPDQDSLDLACELLRVVHERDALRALAARQHALLLAEETLYTETDPGPHCPTCGGGHDGDRQLHLDDCERAILVNDPNGRAVLADSQDVLATVTKLSEQRDALGKALMEIAQATSASPAVRRRALAALRDAGLLPEEEA